MVSTQQNHNVTFFELLLGPLHQTLERISTSYMFRLEVKDKVCPACGAFPFTQKSLDRHFKRAVCPSQFSCDMCDLKFRKTIELNVHKNSDHK